MRDYRGRNDRESVKFKAHRRKLFNEIHSVGTLRFGKNK